MSFEPLFDLRYRVARLGEDDWLRWWTSYALSRTGVYLVPRLFRRTPRLSAAHLAIGAARVRHDFLLPREPRVHLFDFGESVEGEFERWLVERKAAGWEPESLPSPTADVRSEMRAALARVGVTADEPSAGASTGTTTPGALALGSVPRHALDTPVRRLRIARQLASAYVASGPATLIPPYLRLSEA